MRRTAIEGRHGVPCGECERWPHWETHGRDVAHAIRLSAPRSSVLPASRESISTYIRHGPALALRCQMWSWPIAPRWMLLHSCSDVGAARPLPQPRLLARRQHCSLFASDTRFALLDLR